VLIVLILVIRINRFAKGVLAEKVFSTKKELDNPFKTLFNLIVVLV